MTSGDGGTRSNKDEPYVVEQGTLKLVLIKPARNWRLEMKGKGWLGLQE